MGDLKNYAVMIAGALLAVKIIRDRHLADSVMHDLDTGMPLVNVPTLGMPVATDNMSAMVFIAPAAIATAAYLYL